MFKNGLVPKLCYFGTMVQLVQESPTRVTWLQILRLELCGIWMPDNLTTRLAVPIHLSHLYIVEYPIKLTGLGIR